MNISAIKYSNQTVQQTTFKGNEQTAVKNDTQINDKVALSTKSTPSKSKKWAVGIASFCTPGVGQAINGEWGKGAAFFAGGIAFTCLNKKLPCISFFDTLALRAIATYEALKNVKADAE